MAKIFICYRREDSAYPAHQIYEKLTNHFGAGSVVFDVDTIPLGKDFREYLNNQVSECDILLAIIGDQWIKLLKQRVDDPKDFVQIEIQAALKRDIPVVPILVGNALVPVEKDMPPELIGLSYRNAAEVRAGPDLVDHIKRLIKGLDYLLAERKTGEGNSKATETKIKPDKPEPVKEKPPEPKPDPAATSEPTAPDARRTSKFLKISAIAGVIVLLMVGTWFLISMQSPSLKAGQVFRDNLKGGGTGPEMIILAAGNFMMGSPDTEEYRGKDEGPQNRVTISRPYALSIHEITFAEYDSFADTTGRQLPKDEGWGRLDRPVINVSWEDATAYARWLSEQTGQDYRLPTEAEWEYAVRSGSTTAYSFGADPSRVGEYAWYNDNSGNKTHPVGQKKPNAWGLYDMHGNVWEWVEDDWHENYNGAPDDGRAWIDDPRGAGRVVRGGSWYFVAHGCRSAYRNYYWPDFRNDLVGFRLSRSVALDP